MKAAVIDEDRNPQVRQFRDPEARPGMVEMKVNAAALTNLDVGVAEGRHYFSTTDLPAVVGREAVATSDAGERFYLNPLAIPQPFGSMAERTLVDPAYALPVPERVPDDVAAALGNAGLAGWLPLSWRAHAAPGERVLILGATGTTGSIAVAAASLLGAGRVVAAGRNPAALERLLDAGADAVVRLDDTFDLTAGFLEAADGRVDVVVDYLNGPATAAAAAAMAERGRLVHVGALLAPTIALNAQMLRRRSLDVLGFAYYHAPIESQVQAYANLCDAALAGRFELGLQTVPLDDFEIAWRGQKAGNGRRYVIQP